jgi:hypothetical protein
VYRPKPGRRASLQLGEPGQLQDARVVSHVAVHLWQVLGFRIIGTVPATFDSKAHGLVGLHVMYLPLV